MYSVFSGIKDGVLWGRKGADSFKIDEHKIFYGERASISILIVLIALGWWLKFLIPLDLILCEICYLISFPFFHNSSYYESRNKIDNAYRGYWSDSTTSTAEWNFNFKTRVILFIFSLLILITYEIFKYIIW